MAVRAYPEQRARASRSCARDRGRSVRRSGEDFHDVDGSELEAELGRQGLAPDFHDLKTAMFGLRDRLDLIECYFGGGFDVSSLELVRLTAHGRDVAQSLPEVGGVLEPEQEALLS